MQDYQLRVIEEQEALYTKWTKLSDFMHSNQYGNIDSINQGLLMVQFVAMENYLSVLKRRIELF
jgi:hypothetical protein